MNNYTKLRKHYLLFTLFQIKSIAANNSKTIPMAIIKFDWAQSNSLEMAPASTRKIPKVKTEITFLSIIRLDVFGLFFHQWNKVANGIIKTNSLII